MYLLPIALWTAYEAVEIMPYLGVVCGILYWITNSNIFVMIVSMMLSAAILLADFGTVVMSFTSHIQILKDLLLYKAV